MLPTLRLARRNFGLLTEALNAKLAPVRNQPYVVLHDGFQYFEDRFRIPALGAIRLSDGAAPSPRRLATLRRGIKASGARCIFREPQYASALAAGLAGPDVRTGVLDPLGWDLEAGWSLYPALLQTACERTFASVWNRRL